MEFCLDILEYCSQEELSSPAEIFAKNLVALKAKTIIWAREKRRKDDEDLQRIELPLLAFEESVVERPWLTKRLNWFSLKLKELNYFARKKKAGD